MMERRRFLKGAALGAAYLTVSGPGEALGAKQGITRAGKPVEAAAKAFKYRIGFGCWINDMRCTPLPLEDWPAPEFDDECVNGLIRCMDVQRENGYNMNDVWGYFATHAWPVDIVSAVDKERRRRLNRVLKAAKERGIKPVLGFGTYSWGYDKIIAADPSVEGRNPDGSPQPNAMCDANPKSFEYVKQILDFALGEFDFAGVHLESCDQGCCQCPQCTGKYGFVGYHVRINEKTADYIKRKWPDKIVYSITISWLQGHPHFNAEEKAHLIDLSKHVDCIFDQGHVGYQINPAERVDFIKQLHCAYGTSGKLWLYPDVRFDRASFFLPYVKRAVTAIKEQYEDGVRGLLLYQGPVSNAGTEVQIAANGRAAADPSKSVAEILGEVVDRYYKPKTARVHQQLVDLFLRAEDCYFGNWPHQIEAFERLYYGANSVTDYPGEFKLYNGLFGKSPGPASYLLDPMLDFKGRKVYKEGLESILADLPSIEGKCHDQGRVENIKRSLIITLTELNTIALVQNWPCSTK